MICGERREHRQSWPRSDIARRICEPQSRNVRHLSRRYDLPPPQTFNVNGTYMRTLAAATLLIAATSGHAAGSVQSIIDGCWKGHDHAGMTACVAAHATTARSDLTTAEETIRAALRRQTDEPGFPNYRRDAISHLENADAAFKRYRSNQCAYQAALAAKGDGAEDIRAACEAMLDSDRTEQLRASQPSL